MTWDATVTLDRICERLWDLVRYAYIDYDHVDFFRHYAADGFELEYLVLVSNQFGPHKINVYGFGKMENMDYR